MCLGNNEKIVYLNIYIAQKAPSYIQKKKDKATVKSNFINYSSFTL